jgi:cysteine desulfuration protein SufE
MTQSFDDIAADFAYIDDWDERYRYLIDLGKRLAPLPEGAHSEENKVRGCASQVWLLTGEEDGRLTVRGDSDAAIVKGLVALMIALFGGRTRAEVAQLDAEARLAELDLKEHITPQRSNGVASMIRRLKAEGA